MTRNGLKKRKKMGKNWERKKWEKKEKIVFEVGEDFL